MQVRERMYVVVMIVSLAVAIASALLIEQTIREDGSWLLVFGMSLTAANGFLVMFLTHAQSKLGRAPGGWLATLSRALTWGAMICIALAVYGARR